MNDYNFGNKITKYRSKLGLSQSELGSMIGVTNKAVSKWENGIAKPNIDAISKLSSIFGLTIDELLKGEENSNITKIVITGGPCAGKTSAKSWIDSEFTKLGYHVIFVNETATDVICSGINPNILSSRYEFQKAIFEYQLFKENMTIDVAKKIKGKVLIVFDRGLLDSMVYVSPAEFNRLLVDEHTNIVEIRDRYDAIIHLVSAAKGAKDFYTLENNNARQESIDEAVDIDTRTINAYVGHPHLRVVDNSTDFKSKMLRLIKEISSLLGEPDPYEIERKFLIKKPNIEKLEKMPNCAKSEIIQTYLKTNDNEEETRIRQRGIDGNYSYTKTTKIKVSDIKRVEKEQRISKDEYIRLLINADSNYRQIQKTRYCLCYDNHYYEIDIFPFMEDTAIMEVELINENEEFKIPKFIEVLEEVTNKDEYKNHNLAKIKDHQ